MPSITPALCFCTNPEQEYGQRRTVLSALTHFVFGFQWLDYQPAQLSNVERNLLTSWSEFPLTIGPIWCKVWQNYLSICRRTSPEDFMRLFIIVAVSILLASFPLLISFFFLAITLPRKMLAVKQDMSKLSGTGDGGPPPPPGAGDAHSQFYSAS